MRRVAAAVALAALAATSCFGADPGRSASGAGLPELEISFPERSEGGSTQTATLTITNPGPQPISTVVVAFARVGPGQGGSELPAPIVDGGFEQQNPAVAAVRPPPRRVSQPATEFFFGPLGEGETTTIEFDLEIPDTDGEAANSVTVYDGSDPERIRGARLSTTVGP